jgi:hypothetical protein
MVRATKVFADTFVGASRLVVQSLQAVIEILSLVITGIKAIPTNISITITTNISAILSAINSLTTALSAIPTNISIIIEIDNFSSLINQIQQIIDSLNAIPRSITSTITTTSVGTTTGGSTLRSTSSAVTTNQNFSFNFAGQSVVGQTEAQTAILLRQNLQRQLANV